MESTLGGKEPEKNAQAKLRPPLPTQPPRVDPVDHKRKRDQRNQDLGEGGKGPLPKDAEPQKGAKQTRMTQNLTDKRAETQVRVPVWAPPLVLDGAPLLSDASIRCSYQEKAGYFADALELALLLLANIFDLRTMRKHEVFFSLKRDLAQVILLITFVTFTFIALVFLVPILILDFLNSHVFSLLFICCLCLFLFIGCPGRL